MEGDEDVAVVDDVGDLRVCPDGCFHLAAVDASVACEIEHDRLVVLPGVCHALVIVLKLWGYFPCVEVEVLGADGWGEGADGLARCAP